MRNSENGFWNTDDAEYHEAVNKWASKKFGNDWHDKYEWWWMEKLYDKYVEDKTKISDGT